MLAIQISHACSRLMVVPHPHLKGSPIRLGLVMPRQAQMQNTTVLEEGMASLTQSLQSVSARLHEERKRNRKRSSRELSARRRHVQEALTILILHDSDRRWLPAFMRKHGMSGVGEELSAFDEEVCSSFLTLSVEEINTMRDPPDRPGQTRLRQAALASLSNKCMPGWPTKTNATASHLQSVTRCSIGTSSQPPRIRRCTRHLCGVCRNLPGSNGLRGSDADGGWVPETTRARGCTAGDRSRKGDAI